MEDLDNKLKYTTGLPAEYFKYNGEGLPSTYAIIWCMMATGVSRIFTKNDLKEFLFRLPIALNSLDLVETWFMKDRLMNYTYKEKYYVLKLEDVVMHFGLEAYDYYLNYSPREKYLGSVSNNITAAMITGLVGEFHVIPPEITDDDVLSLSVKDHIPEITPELVAKAEFFAGDLMKFITAKTFTESNQAIKEKEKELEGRRKRIRNIPVFEIKKIPADIILQCLEIMYKEDYVKHLLNNPDEFEKEAKPLMYLAWLIANDFMILAGLDTRETEEITLNCMDYELEGGGYDLGETIEMYNIEEMRSLLKGLMY